MSDQKPEGRPEDQEPIIPEPVHEHEIVPRGEMRARHGGRAHCLDAATKNAILNHIRKVGYHLPSLAAIAGVKPYTLSARLKDDPEFDLEIQQARSTFLAKLEAEATRRAVEGWDVPITIAGEADVQRKFSDQLLLHLLKKNAPEKHGDRVDVHQHTTLEAADRVAEKFDMNLLTVEERAQLRQLLYKARVTGQDE